MAREEVDFKKDEVVLFLIFAISKILVSTRACFFPVSKLEKIWTVSRGP